MSSSSQKYNSENIFQKIVDGEGSAYRIFEDTETLAMLDIFPRVRGEILVLPKHPAVNLLVLPEKFVGSLFRTSQKMAQLLLKTFDIEDIVILQLNGSKAGQTVFYTHVHVLPVYPDIGHVPLSSPPDNALSSPDALKEIQEQLLTCL